MNETIQKKKLLSGNAVFVIVFFAILAAIAVSFNLITHGTFLDWINIKVIISHCIYPTFVAWGLCFLFACGYTDMSLGGVLVLGSFAACAFGNAAGYPGVVIGGLVVGVVLVFINFNIFAYTRIPSWIAGLCLAFVYEAIAVMINMGAKTKPYVDTMLDMEYRVLGQLPWSIIILLVVMVIVYLVYNRTTIGLNIRALGGNEKVADSIGVNVNKTLMFVGLISGLLIGCACVLQESLQGRTTVKTGLTSMNMVFQPLAVVFLSQILQKYINIIIAVPICSFVLYATFNLLTLLGVPSGTLQEVCLGAFLILFGVIARWGYKGVVK